MALWRPGGVRGVAVKATESELLVPGAVVSLDYLEVSPTKLLHRMRQGLSALLAWQQTVLGKGLPKHLTVEASPLPFLSLAKPCVRRLVGRPQGHAAL